MDVSKLCSNMKKMNVSSTNYDLLKFYINQVEAKQMTNVNIAKMVLSYDKNISFDPDMYDISENRKRLLNSIKNLHKLLMSKIDKNDYDVAGIFISYGNLILLFVDSGNVVCN